MKLLMLLTCLICIGAGMTMPISAQQAYPTKRVLVLYDQPDVTDSYSQLYAMHLVNLISHFEAELVARPVNTYSDGQMEAFDYCLYLGTWYDNGLPDSFKSDVLTGETPVFWIGVNLWQIAWTPEGAPEPAFESRFGFRFNLMEETTLYDKVYYNNQTLVRHPDSGPVGRVTILNPSLASIVAHMSPVGSTTKHPYLVRSGKLWYMCDIPFTYVTMTDRYLVLADTLHDFLQENHPTEHKALIRIEDVHPSADPNALRAIADVLASENVPFAISVIPQYLDPLGTWNGGVPLTVDWKDRPEMVSALQYMVSKGGEVIQHGTTHQYSNWLNPFSGVTGEDWEFYIVQSDGQGGYTMVGPPPEDSIPWARERVLNGYSWLNELGFNPVAWLTPHYVASMNAYEAIGQVYGTSLDRGCYTAKNSSGGWDALLQLTPYVLKRDVTGSARLPENIDYVDPTPGAYQQMPADLIARAPYYYTAVRDGWVRMYFHWFLDPSLLRELLQGIKALGFTYVSPSSAIPPGMGRKLP